MPLNPQTAYLQDRLARICKVGESRTLPGVSQERADIYRSLIRNGVEDCLSRAFPLCKKLLKARSKSLPNFWDVLVDDFLSDNNACNPELWRMPQELLAFAANRQYSRMLELPFIDDLLRFEWAEVELYMMADIVRPRHSPVGDINHDRLVINPEHVIMEFEFPVFKVPVLNLDESHRGNYVLAAYRTDAGKVRFMEVNRNLSAVLQKLSECPSNIDDCLLSSASANGSEGELKRALINFVTSSISEGLILGFFNVGDKNEESH